MGVREVARSIETEILPVLRGLESAEQDRVDSALREIDGTARKQRLGANALLVVSIVCARASARERNVPLYEALGGEAGRILPVPFFNVINGGVHAPGGLDVQEFLIAPGGAPSFGEALRWGAEIYARLGEILRARFSLTGVGDEGGYVAGFRTHEEAFEVLIEAIEKTGLRPRDQVSLAIDSAASEFLDDQRYVLARTGSARLTSTQLVDLYSRWVNAYPIESIEDGLAERDDSGWIELTRRLGDRLQILGDDNFVTNPELIRRGQTLGIANAVLIKPNQIGTVSETIAAIDTCVAGEYRTMMSHRSGETCDDFIADLSVARGVGQIKSGAPCRGERLAKYNRLAQIELELGANAKFAGFAFRKMGGPA
jgi:enolase